VTARVLVAGVGNVFLGDDAFGVEVARRLADEPMPDDVHVVDYGIRGVHLAYELLEGYESLVLIDAMAQGGSPGDLYVFEPARNQGPGNGLHDAHDLSPATVLALVDDLANSFGGGVERVVVVGCEPSQVDESMGLSVQVEAALPAAMRLVREVAEELAAVTRETGGGGDGASSDCRPGATGDRSLGSAVAAGSGEVQAHPGDVTTASSQ
jgi:hydrogenase maturation protease